MKALWYCTKNKPYLFDCYQGTLERCAYVTCYSESFKDKDYVLNGKIACVSDFEVEKIIPVNATEDDYDYGLFSGRDLLKGSCLYNGDIFDYLQCNGDDTVFKKDYAIFIKDLHVFDKPKKLSDYYKTFERMIYHPNGYYPYKSSTATPCNATCFIDYCDVLKRAPQNMCYVYDKDGVKYVLISVHPKWLKMILNGLKDVEVRREVLKEMRPCK